MTPLWGMDLGGTKIEGIILENATNLNPIKRLRVPTEADKGYEHLLGQVGKLLEVMIGETGIKPHALGIGHPGTLDPHTNTIKNANTTCMNGRPFKEDLERMLGIEVRLSNDANCFAVAETLMGAVQEVLPNAEVAFGVILGTGVGGGIVVHGKVLHGRQGIAGEWGHNFLDASGGKCYCGQVGCVETVISGPALERYYHSISGTRRKLKDIVQLAENQQDKHATLALDRLVHYFGKAIANVINILDPDVIVLGGGVGNIKRLYTDGADEVRKHIFNNRLDTIICPPKLGDSAGVFGAALL